jgi:hypothetical protein
VDEFSLPLASLALLKLILRPSLLAMLVSRQLVLLRVRLLGQTFRMILVKL